MKKIVYIITRIEQSGPNRVLDNMLLGLNKRKYDITLVSLYPLPEKFSSLYECYSFNYTNSFDIIKNSKKIAKIIDEKFNPDIVHSHGILPDYVNSFMKECFRISTLHCNIYDDYSYAHNFLKSFMMIKFHLYVYKRIDKVVCCSKSVYEDMKKSKLKNMCYVDNGIKSFNDNTIKTNIRKELNINKNDIVYIYVGALSKRKNILALVDLFLKNIKSNEHFIILGDGEYKDQVIDLIKDNGNIHYLGFRKDIYNYLGISNVYVSFSLMEGLSISVIEALSKNNLLLLSDIPSHREFFNRDNQYIGELFNSENFGAKIESIRKNIKNIDINLISKYKDRFFSEKSMMKEYMNLYEEK